jgi:DNA-binding transcriptional ArsR family regulator
MVNYTSSQLDAMFTALADPTRREMLNRLSGKVLSVKDLSEPFSMSKPAITKHLKVLERAGLLSRDKVGRVHQCRLEARPLQEAANWIGHFEQFWNQKLDALAEFLDEENKNDRDADV